MEQQTLMSMGSRVPEPKYINEKETANAPIAALTFFSQQVDTELSKQKELILNIQCKLNYILDRRVPEKVDDKITANSEDLMGNLKLGISKLEINNYQLEKILNHLSEII